jgi:hypothetical protein
VEQISWKSLNLCLLAAGVVIDVLSVIVNSLHVENVIAPDMSVRSLIQYD